MGAVCAPRQPLWPPQGPGASQQNEHAFRLPPTLLHRRALGIVDGDHQPFHHSVPAPLPACAHPSSTHICCRFPLQPDQKEEVYWRCSQPLAAQQKQQRDMLPPAWAGRPAELAKAQRRQLQQEVMDVLQLTPEQVAALQGMAPDIQRQSLCIQALQRCAPLHS